MTDYSKLNDKYFIDDEAFNCPFCGLRNTTYTILAILKHDLTDKKSGKIIFVCCNKCKKISIHFAPYDIPTSKWNTNKIGVVEGAGFSPSCVDMSYKIKFLNFNEDDGDFDVDIDSQIYHSIPSSFFTMDERIPNNIRKLFSEAQECQKANLKTGASACLRKLIYTLLSDLLNKKQGDGKTKQSLKSLYGDYSKCIKALKGYYPNLETFIEPLEDIKGITSDQIHEDSWAEISSQDLNICLESIKELLYAIYVQPAVLQERRNKICNMRQKASDKDEKKNK